MIEEFFQFWGWKLPACIVGCGLLMAGLGIYCSKKEESRNTLHLEFFMDHDYVVRADCFVHSPDCWGCLKARQEKKKKQELEDIKF